MHYQNCGISCGVYEIMELRGNMNKLQDFTETVARVIVDEGCMPAHLLFSDYVSKDGAGGRALAKALRGKGTLVRSPARVNPNSGNKIEVFLFTPSARYKSEIRSLAREMEPDHNEY